MSRKPFETFKALALTAGTLYLTSLAIDAAVVLRGRLVVPSVEGGRSSTPRGSVVEPDSGESASLQQGCQGTSVDCTSDDLADVVLQRYPGLLRSSPGRK